MSRQRRTLVGILLGLLVLVLSVGAGVSPAQSDAYPWRAAITFVKNPASPSWSTVVWQLSQLQADGSWQQVQTQSWRAGSGMLGRHGTDSCVRDHGWLPDGDYHVRQYDDYPGSLIKGRVFRLDDKRCANGTLRFDLFLHTETGAHNVQCRDRRGDQLCRWEYPRYDEYKSRGCIKMAPGDLAQLVALYQQHFHAGIRYDTDQVVLRVVTPAA